jgi:hypothetical protein
MNHDGIAQRLRPPPLVKEREDVLCLAPDRSVNVGARDGRGEVARRSDHHRVAEDRHGDVRRYAVYR